MANTNSQKNNSRGTYKSNSTDRNKSTTQTKREPKNGHNVEQNPIVVKDIDPTQYVVVRNGFQGRLVYRSQRTGERFVWDDFGAEQEMELRELRNARNSNKKFFINNWFMFDEDWIVDYLGVRQYYRNAIRIEDFDSIFTRKPPEIKRMISDMSDGQKKSVAYRAKNMITEKKIDSLSVISALEEALCIELIEK